MPIRLSPIKVTLNRKKKKTNYSRYQCVDYTVRLYLDFCWNNVYFYCRKKKEK